MTNGSWRHRRRNDHNEETPSLLLSTLQQVSARAETAAPGGGDLRGAGAGATAAEAPLAERDDEKAAADAHGNAVPVPGRVRIPRPEGQLRHPTIAPGRRVPAQRRVRDHPQREEGLSLRNERGGRWPSPELRTASAQSAQRDHSGQE
ncbi:hypothetical protein K0M31_000813 [Melipona bicolor]|uniref:Uncharacterized protein n=1 Tax=Melipona bicolor TaxID=60889 RepID=A0AA40KX72_9HYME|nr:hypothetical protein K0M31_000813 [Melipona bicolor]